MCKKIGTLDSSKKGSSLVGIIISTGIVMILAATLVDILLTQFSMQKFLSQKLEMMDFTNNLIATMTKSNACNCQFAGNSSNPNLSNYSTMVFDSNLTNGSAFIDLKRVYSGCAGGVHPPFVLAEAGSKLYGSSDLIVDKVRIVDLIPAGNASNPNEWYGAWEISFLVGPGSLQRPSKSIKVNQRFIVNPTVPAQTRISSCGGINVIGGSCPSGQVMTGINPDGTPSCNLGQLIAGVYQTYVCDGTCRRPNAITGACTCPPGFSASQINDFDSPTGAGCGSQTHYEHKGMIQYICVR
jgi:hypothetical protein